MPLFPEWPQMCLVLAVKACACMVSTCSCSVCPLWPSSLPEYLLALRTSREWDPDQVLAERCQR